MRRLILSLTLVVSFVLAGATPGLAAGTLQGETLTGIVYSPDSDKATCQPPNTGFMASFSGVIFGAAAGPYLGSFMEHIFTLSFANGSITSWDAFFQIFDSSGVLTVQGTKSLPATTITATCSADAHGNIHFIVIATVTYQATIYGTPGTPNTTDSGTSLTTLDFVAGTGTIGGTFTESFAPGCNGEGDGQGNDDCQNSEQQ